MTRCWRAHRGLPNMATLTFRPTGSSCRYSPYHNIRKGVAYPPVFLYLSTKDDRVHPGHARKYAARLTENGNRVYYHEYLEGGHSVGADHAEDAVRAAMLHAFLLRELVEKK
jgi:prolyl oligopeptidase